MEKRDFVDLGVMTLLTLKDDMVEQGIIPRDFKWSELTIEQEENIKKFVSKKMEEQKVKRITQKK